MTELNIFIKINWAEILREVSGFPIPLRDLHVHPGTNKHCLDYFTLKVGAISFPNVFFFINIVPVIFLPLTFPYKCEELLLPLAF